MLSFSDTVYVSPPRYRYPRWTMASLGNLPVLHLVVRNLPMSRAGKCNQLACCCRAFDVVWRRQLRRVLRKYMDQIQDNMEERNKGTHLRAHWRSTMYYSSIDTVGMRLHTSIRDLLGMRIDDWCPDMEEDNFDMAWQHHASIQEQNEAEDAQGARRRVYGRQMIQRLPGIETRDYSHPNGQVQMRDYSLLMNQEFEIRDLRESARPHWATADHVAGLALMVNRD